MEKQPLPAWSGPAAETGFWMEKVEKIRTEALNQRKCRRAAGWWINGRMLIYWTSDMEKRLVIRVIRLLDTDESTFRYITLKPSNYLLKVITLVPIFQNDGLVVHVLIPGNLDTKRSDDWIGNVQRHGSGYNWQGGIIVRWSSHRNGNKRKLPQIFRQVIRMMMMPNGKDF